jgi:DNA-binding CsgD family transcriptional regulator
MLRTQFGLTLRKASLAEELVARNSLHDAAEVLSLTNETARSYLKLIFSKTETHKQGELIALLTRLAILSDLA